MSGRVRWFRLDVPTLLLTAALLGFGFAMVWSTSYREGGEMLTGHFVRLGLSLPFLVLPLLVNPQALRRHAGAIYVAAVLLLLAVRFFGITRNGARRWIDFGVLAIQPSEFLKIALVIVLAAVLRDLERAQRGRGVVLALALVAPPSVLILMQPDLGTTMVLLPVVLGMLYAAGARRNHLLALVLSAAVLAPVGFFFLHDYQRARISSWWNQDDLGFEQRMGDGYHLHNSKIAVGTGGAFGQGLGNGPHNQLDYLPYRESDFIFPVVAEELGFVGGTVLIALFGALVARLFALAGGIRDGFGRLLLTGIACLFATHVGMNIGVTVGLVPTTGLNLPLISYGGSSLMASFLALGIALSAVLHHRRVFSEETRRDFVQRLV